MLIKLRNTYYDVDIISKFTRSNIITNGNYTLIIEIDGQVREIRYPNAASIDEDVEKLIKAKGGVIWQ